MIPRFDEPSKKDLRYTHRPGAYGILVQGDMALLTFQSEPEPEFQLPGGGIEAGESPIAALHREVAEETGWGIRILRRLGAFQRFTYMPDYHLWAQKVCHIYLCRPTRMKGSITEPYHSVHWVPLTKAAHILGNGGDRHFVQQYLDRHNRRRTRP